MIHANFGGHLCGHPCLFLDKKGRSPGPFPVESFCLLNLLFIDEMRSVRGVLFTPGWV